MQDLCGLRMGFAVFNCQTPEYNGIDQIEIVFADNTGGMDFPGFEGIYQKTEDLPRQ